MSLFGTRHQPQALRSAVHIPPLEGATQWLNSEPLSRADLRDHVVVVNFWTLTCINWLRQEPYVRAWSQTYRDDGLVVIGVHTPEFGFEHELERVRLATKAMAIRSEERRVGKECRYGVAQYHEKKKQENRL